MGIVYDVEMNARDLFEAPNGTDFSGLARGTVAKTPDVDVYAPFIFKITVAMNEGPRMTACSFSRVLLMMMVWFSRGYRNRR